MSLPKPCPMAVANDSQMHDDRSPETSRVVTGEAWAKSRVFHLVTTGGIVPAQAGMNRPTLADGGAAAHFVKRCELPAI